MAKKVKEESLQQSCIRRLEEYIEFAEARRRFADVGFYNELLSYIRSNPPE